VTQTAIWSLTDTWSARLVAHPVSFQYLRDLHVELELTQNQHWDKIKNQTLNDDELQFLRLHDLLWQRFAGKSCLQFGRKSCLQFGELYIKYRSYRGIDAPCCTDNAALAEGNFIITHGRHNMTLSSYHESYMTKHDKIAVVIYNSYLVVEANSQKSLDTLPMILRLAL